MGVEVVVEAIVVQVQAVVVLAVIVVVAAVLIEEEVEVAKDHQRNHKIVK